MPKNGEAGIIFCNSKEFKNVFYRDLQADPPLWPIVCVDRKM
jgi:hypothetical protein